MLTDKQAYLQYSDLELNIVNVSLIKSELYDQGDGHGNVYIRYKHMHNSYNDINVRIELLI